LPGAKEVDNVLAAVSVRVEEEDVVVEPVQPDEAALVGGALAGDAGAMRRLVDHLLPTVQTRVGLALLRWRSQARGRNLRSETEDLTQEVFASLFDEGGRVLRDWRPERGLGLKRFVGLVAERQAGAILRTGKRSPFTEDPTSAEALGVLTGSGEGAAKLLESRDLLEALVDRLQGRLSVQGFQLFELLYVEERSVEEACALARLSPDAVYAWRSRIGRLAREIRAELLAERQPGPLAEEKELP
jgi:RNA polymerase sigma-70 factor (ECF subfamily)